jgi:type II secretory pathway component GspD/PulD (secretin)
MRTSQFAPLVLILLAIQIPSLTARAESFSEKCSEIASCATVVSQLTGQKYLFDADVKGKMMATPNVDINKDNAELLFTEMLNINGFSRVPTGEPGTYQIMRQRDARDAAIPTFTADEKNAPEFSRNFDLMTMRYKATHPDAVEPLARAMRSFMPANSRIIPDELGGWLLVTDTAPNLKKVYTMVKDMDRKPSAEFKRHWEEMLKERLRNPPPPPQHEHGPAQGQAPAQPKPPGG